LVIGRCNTIYSDVVESIGLRDLEKLKASKIALDELNDEVELLKDTVYCFLKSLDTNSVEANKFYVLILSYLQDLVQSTKYISEDSFLYISNKHQLKFNQIRDLKKIEKLIQNLFYKIEMAFLNKNFEKIDEILLEKTIVLENISELIQKQIIRIRAINGNTKNSDVYFSLLLKTKDVIKSSIDLLILFQNFNPNLKKR
jgi:Na+/phosphate symporter